MRFKKTIPLRQKPPANGKPSPSPPDASPQPIRKPITPEHKAKILANLDKAWRTQKAIKQAREQAKNLATSQAGKGVGVVHGITLETIETPQPLINGPLIEVGRRALRTRLTRYLGGIESVRDFEKIRKQSPLRALEFATDHIWGKPKVQDGPEAPKQSKSIGVLVQILTGITPQAVVVSNIPTDKTSDIPPTSD